MRICRVATVPFIFLHHVNSQIKATVAAGHEVYLVSSPSSGFRDDIGDSLRLNGVHSHAIEIPRGIAFFADLRALIALYRYFRHGRFDVVHSITSKAGFLCAIAAMVARVPIRIHTYIGQPWAGLTGPVRWLSKACDWLIARLNTGCYTDSESQRAFLIEEGIAEERHIKVLGAGSVAGVELSRFKADRFDCGQIRSELSIPDNARTIVFLGRINREKGIVELVAAFEEVVRRIAGAIVLLIVGPFESDALPELTRESIQQNSSIKICGYTDSPERFLAIADIFCLPSYREGFGSVVIEAAAMGVPTVATCAVGLVDSVVDGETGLLVPIRDAASLADALIRLLVDEGLRTKLGAAARARAYQLFDSASVNQLVVNEYHELHAAQHLGQARKRQA